MFSEIIISGWPANEPLPDGLQEVSDNFAGLGPLGGIEAALRVSSGSSLFVFGGDMPWLSPLLICQQYDYYRKAGCDILVPRINERSEPLHSIYRKKVHERLFRYLKSGGNCAVRKFTETTAFAYFDLPDTAENRKSFSNINSPSDLLHP